MSDAVTLFGTDQPPVEGQLYAVGPWSFTLEDGALRHIALQDHEAIRNIAFLVRDRDWGTLVPALDNLQVAQTDTTLAISFDAVFNSNDAELSVRVSIDVSPESLVISATGHLVGSFETNRAGFTVLHPIEDVAGQPVRVRHSDGLSEDSTFPDLIHPWRPFVDIAALTNRVGSVELCCAFHGDTFEMEDQRQWGDASFKTYNRPLDLPWPYVIADGARLSQSVELTWAPCATSPVLPVETDEVGSLFPEMALVIDAQDALRLADNPSDIAVVNPQRLLCHFDAELGGTITQFAAFAAAQRACPDQVFDLELICLFDDDPAKELTMLAAQMRDAGFAPDSILVCPSVDRQSTPPGSEWPDCPPLTDIHYAASRAFPDVTRGGGMVSFFPELNRKRPPLKHLDFVSHGLCPIVHAADDVSVIETLEAIPHITRSAGAIIGDKDYRIGPATIAMRQNPYGARTITSPDHERICMAHDDPRHRAKFGAAYVIGLASALASSGLSVWTPAALYGSRGVIADEGQWPISAALKALAERAGKKVHSARVSDGLAEACIGTVKLKANLTAQAQQSLGAYEWSMADVSASEAT